MFGFVLHRYGWNKVSEGLLVNGKSQVELRMTKLIPWLAIGSNLLAMFGCWHSGDPFLMTGGVTVFGLVVLVWGWAAWMTK